MSQKLLYDGQSSIHHVSHTVESSIGTCLAVSHLFEEGHDIYTTIGHMYVVHKYTMTVGIRYINIGCVLWEIIWSSIIDDIVWHIKSWKWQVMFVNIIILFLCLNKSWHRWLVDFIDDISTIWRRRQDISFTRWTLKLF